MNVMKYSSLKLITILLLIGLFGCKSSPEKFNEADYIESIREWQKKRLENLKSENGWLNLVGLYWLNDGENPFGSSEANNIVFPKNAPEFIGSYSVFQNDITVSIYPDVDVYINDSL